MKRLRNRQLRWSRVLLTGTGLVLVALAVVGLLLATDAVRSLGGGRVRSGGPLLTDTGLAWIDAHQRAVRIATFATGVVLLVLGQMLLRLQVPPIRRQHDQRLPNLVDDTAPGANRIRGRALADALESDLERSPLVRRARAEIHPDHDLVRLRLDVHERATTDQLSADVIGPAVARLSRVAQLDPGVTVRADISPGGDRTNRPRVA